jgi:aspartate dehydrogenase
MTGIGLLGCGAIGREIAGAVRSGEAGGAFLAVLFDQDPAVARSLAGDLDFSGPVTDSVDRLLSAPEVEMVVECASPHAVRAHAETVLAHGKDMLLMSSGALTDAGLSQRLAVLVQERGVRLIVPSGAIGGIDAIRALKGRLDQVTLTTTKPPRGLRGAAGFRDWESREITEPQIIFEGSALEAVKLFPANVNVAATLSLAGIGAEKTRVVVMADPRATLNRHEVEARGDFGVLRFQMELRPHERNPRTSFLAIASAIEALRAACSSGIEIGT